MDPKCVENELRAELTEPAYMLELLPMARIKAECDEANRLLAIRTELLDATREQLAAAWEQRDKARAERDKSWAAERKACRNLRCVSILFGSLLVVLLGILAVQR